MKKNRLLVPALDLFAGPGGLSEGFCSLSDAALGFDVRLSIEKDAAAHRTLELRTFYRQFAPNLVPDDYYEYVRGEGVDRDALFCGSEEGEAARREAWRAELGVTPQKEVDQRISTAIGAAKDWVLIGGPPCQAYSVAGRSRYANLRRNDLQAFESDHRHYLYREYLRILAKFNPTIFVMENVKGILSSTINGERIFNRILSDLSNPHSAVSSSGKKSKQKAYRVYSVVVPCGDPIELGPKDFVIKAEKHGVPQTRHRVILLGIREDLKTSPAGYLEERPEVTVRDVIDGLPRLRSSLSREKDDFDAWRKRLVEAPTTIPMKDLSRKLAARIRGCLRNIDPTLAPGGRFVEGDCSTIELNEWFLDPRLNGALNHEARAHMTSDLHRYLYLACAAEITGVSPKLRDFPRELWPKHKNAKLAATTNSGYFQDRFRVQVPDQPATTVVSHIRKDGHYYIHFDPSQCRSFTVREAARIQTFPDNYFFEGNRTEQYEQVGNAVPPLLARQIAEIVAATLRSAWEAPKFLVEDKLEV